MALSQGELATAADFNAVKNAITNAYTKTVGSAPSWNANATVSAGTLITAAAITELNSKGWTAAQYYQTSVSCSSNHTSNAANTNYCNNVRAGTFSVAYRYWRGQKCGGQILKFKWKFLWEE